MFSNLFEVQEGIQHIFIGCSFQLHHFGQCASLRFSKCNKVLNSFLTPNPFQVIAYIKNFLMTSITKQHYTKATNNNKYEYHSKYTGVCEFKL